MTDCSCFWTDPKTWSYYGGVAEPGSQMELNDDCPVHGAPFPEVAEPRTVTEFIADEVKKSGRPDAMDHELGMLYKLRLRLQDEMHMQVSPFDPMHLAGWRDPRMVRHPGLRVALEIVELEIELRNRI